MVASFATLFLCVALPMTVSTELNQKKGPGLTHDLPADHPAMSDSSEMSAHNHTTLQQILVSATNKTGPSPPNDSEETALSNVPSPERLIQKPATLTKDQLPSAVYFDSPVLSKHPIDKPGKKRGTRDIVGVVDQNSKSSLSVGRNESAVVVAAGANATVDETIIHGQALLPHAPEPADLPHVGLALQEDDVDIPFGVAADTNEN